MSEKFVPPNDLRNISRIEQHRPDKGSTLGWYVRVQHNLESHSKLFSDGQHGGKAEALERAIAYRNKLLRKFRN